MESWTPVGASALNEWARQRMLSAALSAPQIESTPDPEPEGSRIETTPEELASFEIVTKLLGKEQPVEYEDTVSYFKIHIAGKRTRVIARLLLGRKQPVVWFPLPLETASSLARGRTVSSSTGWSVVPIDSHAELGELGELFRAAYAAVSQGRATGVIEGTA